MKNTERCELLEDAKDKLREVVDLIAEAVAGTDEQLRAESYIIPHLTSWLDNTTSCSHNSLDDIIKALPDDSWLTCEDCDETSDDVAICTEPVRSSVQIDPPDSAALCSRCHDRRLHPKEYYDGPDRRDEDGD